MSEISFLRLRGLNREIDLTISSIFSEDVRPVGKALFRRLSLVMIKTNKRKEEALWNAANRQMADLRIMVGCLADMFCACNRKEKSFTHTHNRTHKRTRTHTRTHAHANTHTLTRSHAHTPPRTHMHAHARTRITPTGIARPGCAQVFCVCVCVFVPKRQRECERSRVLALAFSRSLSRCLSFSPSLARARDGERESESKLAKTERVNKKK